MGETNNLQEKKEITIINESWNTFTLSYEEELDSFVPIDETEKLKLLFEILNQKEIAFQIEKDYEKDLILVFKKEDFKEIRFLFNQDFELSELELSLFMKKNISKPLNLNIVSESIEVNSKIFTFVFSEDLSQRELTTYSFLEENSVTDTLILNKNSITNTRSDIIYLLLGILFSDKVIIDFEEFYTELESYWYANVFDKINSIAQSVRISSTSLENLYKSKNNLFYLTDESFLSAQEVITTLDEMKISDAIWNIKDLIKRFWFQDIEFALFSSKSFLNILFLISIYFKIEENKEFDFNNMDKEIKRIVSKENQEFKIMFYLIYPLFEKYILSVKSSDEFKLLIKKITKKTLWYI